jgi:hypothetical protein
MIETEFGGRMVDGREHLPGFRRARQVRIAQGNHTRGPGRADRLGCPAQIDS